MVKEKEIVENVKRPRCGFECDKKITLTHHLKKCYETSEEIKEVQKSLSNVLLKKDIESKLKMKATKILKYGNLSSHVIKIRETKLKKYGSENYNNINKHKNTMLEKYGVENCSQIEEIKRQKEQTSIKHFGVPYATQNKEVSSRIVKNKLEKYGENYFSELLKKSSMKKYGVENFFQAEEVIDKIRNTIKIRYGKDFIQTYKYELPSGKIINVQGYEPQIIDILLKTYKEDDLLFGHEITDKFGNFFYLKKEKVHRLLS